MDCLEHFGSEDYKTVFDPMKYLLKYYNDYNMDSNGVDHFAYKNFYHIFYDILAPKFADNENSRFLEIGTGPSLLLTLFAGHAFRDIYLSDFSERNRSCTKQSLDGAASSFDWKPRVDHIRKHGFNVDKNSFEELQQKVKAILECNVKNTNVLTESMDQVDAIAATLCLEPACDTLDEYREASKNVIGLLKPFGYCVQSGVLHHAYYESGAGIFRSLSATKREVLDTLNDNGIEVKGYEEFYAPDGPWAKETLPRTWAIIFAMVSSVLDFFILLRLL